MSMVTMVSMVAVGSAATAVYFCVAAFLRRRRRARDIFRRQGIDGPSPSSFLRGNLSEVQARAVASEDGGAGPWDLHVNAFDDYSKKIFPFFDKCRNAYGDTYLLWLGQRPALYVTDPELIREIGRCVSLDMGNVGF